MPLSHFNLAKLDAVESGPRAPIARLESLKQSADTAAMKYLSLQCDIYTAKALIQPKKYDQAQSSLQRALVAGEKMGTNLPVAQCHDLLDQVASLTGNASEFQRQQKEAVKILTAVQEEARTDLNGRYGLAPILSARN